MKRTLTLLLFTFFSIAYGRTQCSYCTSLEDAMIQPSLVKSLDLRAQGLTEFPRELNAFPNLKYLNLSSNTIDDIRFDSTLLVSLIELDLSNNPGFNSLEIKGIGKSFPTLKKLSLASCSIRYLSASIAELNRLEELNIANNAIEFLPSELGKIGTLKQLDASNNRLLDAFWIKDLWKIQAIYLEGNGLINANELGKALLFKDSLKLLTVTPGNTRLELSGLYADNGLSELRIVGGAITVFDNGICKSQSLTKLVIDGSEIEDMERLFDWINRFKQLETVEFRNMELDGGLDQIQNVKEIRFVNCKILQLESLRNIPPKISVVGVSTAISMDGYVGNAKVASTGDLVASVSSEVKMSDEMMSNSLTSFVDADQTVISIRSDEPQKIALDFSSYDIPSNAFLTADGKIYEGEVTLKVKEYDNAIENALAGVPMIFRNGGTNAVFASSGMIDFRAYDEKGEELQANPENVIQVELRNLQPTESTNLYAYNEEAKNWEEIGAPEVASWEAMKRKFLDSLNQLPDSEFFKRRIVPIGIHMKHKGSSKDAYRLSFEASTRKPLKRQTYSGIQAVYQTNADQKQITQSDWLIDTVITPEIKDALKEMKIEQKRNQRHWRKQKLDDYAYAPRLITQLHITPDFEDDNYEMTFFFKDSLVSLPVLPNFIGSTSRIQIKEKKNWADYERAKKKERKESEELDSWKTKFEKKLAAEARERMADLLVRQAKSAQERKEQLSFGLSKFGLVNCDYFSRNVPSRYLQYDSTATDMDGNWVRVPSEVRNIMLDDNSFVSTSSATVPEYDRKKSIVLFSIGVLEIAVVKGFERLKNGMVRPIVERISTDGIPPDEVRKKVLAVGGE